MYYNPEERDGLLGMIRRARILEVDDSGTQQRLKVAGLASEQLDKIVWQGRHGFASHPPAGSEALLLALGGRSDRAMLIGGEHKDKRPKDLPAGASALYDADGKILKLTKDETVLDAGGKPVRVINATTVTVQATERVSVGVDGGRWVVVRSNRVDLGVKSPTETAVPKVMTNAGECAAVFARID